MTRSASRAPTRFATGRGSRCAPRGGKRLRSHSRAIAALLAVTAIFGMQMSAAADKRPAPAKDASGRADDRPVAIAVHGGAGTIRRKDLTPALERDYRRALERALRAGHRELERGGAAVQAVIDAVTVLEDSPLFNAGKGSVFTAGGANELDAAIMDGASRNAGAAAGLRHVRNPILLAREVMLNSPHVLLVGEGAEDFALTRGLTLVPREYFYTERRWRQLQEAREAERSASLPPAYSFGTVGAVALDRDGNLAAGTSTGGMTNKRWGRMGDVPVIGAGTYADNASCAVSATGHGEYFIRAVVAHDIAALMRYGGRSLAEATQEVIGEKLVAFGGSGGVIALDGRGNVSMVHNTPGMYRGSIDAEGRLSTAIFAD